MSDRSLELLDSINQRLDAKRLLEGIGFHVDRLRSIGSSIKTPCPLHGDSRLSALIVDTDHNTCQCMVASCRARRSMTLVEFFGLCQHQEGLAAAMGAAKLSGLELSSDEISQLTSVYLDEAESASKSGDRTRAIKTLQEARQFDTGNISIPLLSARIAEENGDLEGACSEYAVAARLSRRHDRFEEAEDIICNHLLRLRPEDEHGLLELADTLEAMGDEKRFQETLLKICDLNEQRKKSTDNVMLFERMLDVVEQDPGLALRYAHALESRGDRTAAHKRYLSIADACADEQEEAIEEALRGACRLDPESVEIRERLGEALMRLGREVEAIEELTEAGRLAGLSQEYTRALEIYERVLQRDAGSVSAREGLAEAFEQLGELGRAAEEHLVLAGQYEEMGLEDQATEHLIAARKARPDDPELRVRLGNQLFRDSAPAAAYKEFLEAARIYLERGDSAAAEEVLDGLFHRAPSPVEVVQSICALYESLEREEEAIERCRAYFAETLENDQEALAWEISELALKVDAGSPAANQMRFEFLVQSEHLDEALEWFDTLYPLLTGNERDDLVIHDLEALIEKLPDREDPKRLLADHYRDQGETENALKWYESLLAGALPGVTSGAREVADEVLALEAGHGLAWRVVAESERGAGHDTEALGAFLSAAEGFADEEDAEQQLACLSAAVDLAPTSWEALSALVEFRRGRGEWDEYRTEVMALVRCEESSQHAATVRENQQVCEERFGKDLEVAESFLRWELANDCQAVTPDRVTSLARELAKTGEEERCVDLLRALLGARGDCEEARSLLIETLAKTGREEEGLQLVHELITRYLEADQVGKAREALRRYEELAGSSWDKWGHICELFAAESLIDDAIGSIRRYLSKEDQELESARVLEACEMGLRLHPDDVSLLRQYCVALEKEGRTEEAEKHSLRLAVLLEGSRDPGAAKTVLGELIEKHPSSEEARTRLAELHERLGESPEAKDHWVALGNMARDRSDGNSECGYLQKALRLDPEDFELGELTAECLLAENREQDARDEFLRLAETAIPAGNSLLASRMYVRALELVPEDLETWSRHIALLEEGERTCEAGQACLEAAKVALSLSVTEDAVDYCRRACAHLPEDAERQRAAAELLWENGMPAEAVELLAESAETHLEKEDYEKAKGLLEAARDYEQESPHVLRPLARACLGLGDQAAAISCLNQAAAIYYGREDLEWAEESWSEVRELDSANIEALEGLAGVLSQLGADRESDRLAVLRDLAVTHSEQEHFEEAAERYREMLEVDAALLDARDSLARLYLAQEDIDRALEEFLHLARAYEDEGKNTQAARDYYAKILELDAENIEALHSEIELSRQAQDLDNASAFSIRLASVYEKQGRIDEAIETIERLVGLDEENIEGCQILAAYKFKAGRPNEAIDLLVQTAETLVERREPGRAAVLLRQAEENSEGDALVLRRVGKVYIAANCHADGVSRLHRAIETLKEEDRGDEALEVADELIAIDQADLTARGVRAGLLESAGRLEDAADELLRICELSGERQQYLDLYRRVSELSPGRVDERKRLAEMLFEEGRYEEAAREYADLASLCLSNGEGDLAREFFRKAVLLHPENTGVHEDLLNVSESLEDAEGTLSQMVWLARHSVEKGEKEAARELYGKAVGLFPEDYELHDEFGGFLSEEGHKQEALQQYLKAAQLAANQGDLERAASSLEQARDLNPDDASVRRTLADVLRRTGRTDEAVEEFLSVFQLHLTQGLVDVARDLLDSIREKMEGESGVRLRERAARLYEEHSIPELAAKEYLELARYGAEHQKLEAAENDARKAVALTPRSEEALQFLAEMLRARANEEEALGVLRALADIQLERGALQQALGTLQEMTRLSPSDIEARRSLADLHGRMGQTEDQVRELKVIAEEQLSREDRAGAAGTHAQVLEIAPEEVDVREELLRYLLDSGADASDLTDQFLYLVDAHKERSEWSKAFECLEWALEHFPGDASIRRAKVELLVATDDMIAAYEEGLEVSRLLDGEGRTKEAVELLGQVEDAGSGQAEYHLQLARLLGKQNARGRALQELRAAAERFAQEGKEDRRAEALEEILEIDPQNEHYRAELVEYLRRSERHEEASEHQLVLADIYRQRGLYDLAEAQYSEVLQSSPDNEAAWERYFETHLQTGEERELIPSYLRYVELLNEKKEYETSLVYLNKAILLEPADATLRERYIETYLKEGEEEDLCEDYLVLADLYVASGRVDEAIDLYNKVMSIDPGNAEAREKLSETHQRVSGQIAKPKTPKPAPPLFVDPNAIPGVSSAGAASPPAERATPYLDGDSLENDSLDLESEDEVSLEEVSDTSHRQTLEGVVRNYEDILAINPQNANVRTKVAEVLRQLNRIDEAVTHLRQASETLFERGELDLCISVCDKILEMAPTDQQIRLRLKHAFNKRDAFKALESAIQYTDKKDDTGDQPIPRTGG